MKLSVIVPVYNGAEYIQKIAETMQAQTLTDWELIFVNDGSTDGSGGLCDTLAGRDARIRVLHQTNRGVSAARNAGMAAAKGMYIGFMDCDDDAEPDMYERLLKAAETTGSEMAMGGYFKCGASARVPVSIGDEGVCRGDAVKAVAYSMAFWRGIFGGQQQPVRYGSVWPNLYRTDMLRSAEICFPEHVILGEDLLFNLTVLSRIDQLVLVNRPLYHYNIANVSATRKRNEALWQRYKLLMTCVEAQLRQDFGDSAELRHNVERQYLHYAISVAEEQICPFLKGKACRKALRELCRDVRLRKATADVLRHGNAKEKVQALLFRCGQTMLLERWLRSKA